MAKLTGSFWQFESNILAQSLGLSLSLENLTVDKDGTKRNHSKESKFICLISNKCRWSLFDR